MPPRLQSPPRAEVPKSQAAKLRFYFPAFVEWRQEHRGGLVFPMTPNMANSRCHWRAKDAARRTYFGELDTLRSMGLLPEPPEEPPPHAVITVALHTMRDGDFDNSVARIKWACDWLTQRGYIKDDRRECLSWSGMPTQQRCGKTPPRIEIELS